MSGLVPDSGRIGAYHGLYVGPQAGASMNAFWAANARFLRRKRQTLLDVAIEASAAQAQVWGGFDDRKRPAPTPCPARLRRGSYRLSG